MAKLTTARSMLRRTRWVWISVLALFAALALCEGLGWPFLRQPLERSLGNSLMRPVSFGNSFALRFVPAVHLRTEALTVGAPAGAPGSALPFLRAQGFDLVVPHSTLFALLHPQEGRQLVVRSMAVDTLDLNLLRGSDGAANWVLDAKRPPSATPPRLPSLQRLSLREGRIRIDDAPSQLDVKATLQMIAPRAGEAGGTNRLIVGASGSYRGQPLKAQGRSSGWVPLAAHQPDAGVAIAADLEVGTTHLKFDGRVDDLLRLDGLDARFDLAGRSLAAIGQVLGVTLPTTAAFTMNGRVRNAGPHWDASIAQLHVGSSRLHGQFRYAPGEPRPRLTGTLGGSRLALVDLAPAFGAPPGPGASTALANRTGRVLPRRPLNMAALQRMDAAVDVKLDSADFGTPSLQALAPLHGRLELRDGVLSINDLLARTASGEVRGLLSIDSRQTPPRWHGDLRLAGVDLERFVKVRRGAAAGSSGPGYISGQLSGRAKLQGHGLSTAAALASLDGSIDAWISRGSISHLLLEMSGIDVAESLGLMVTGDDRLALQCAVTRLEVRRGVLEPEVAVIDTSDTTLLASGSVSLADERLALVLTAHPKDFSPLSLRSPVRVEGTLSNPRVKLDARKIGLKAAAAALLAAVAPVATLFATADLGDAEKVNCGNALKRARAPASAERPAPTKPARPGR